MQHPHRATIDEHGNIVLPGAHKRQEQTMEEGQWYEADAGIQAPQSEVREEWYMELEAYPESFEETDDTSSPAREVWSSVRARMYEVTGSVASETVRQYADSVHTSERIGRESVQVTRTGLGRLWAFLRQPVWIPGRKNTPLQRSRGVLFVLDTVRFGGTFAMLFSVLFVGLNYQSFWMIAQSYVDPLVEVTGMAASAEKMDERIAEKLKKIPALAVAGENGGLISHLPLVGPPDNRLVIPKLDLNVPIVVPPNDALIAEDWKQLEESIQHSLQDGVVHYPGTARPGQAGNFFLTGHSSYFPWAPGDFKSVFARLHELNVGDEYWVFYNGDRHRYIVTEEKEIKPSNVSVLNQPPDKRISTLMTCTPVGTTLRRLIISAVEVDPVSGEELEVGENGNDHTSTDLQLETLPI